MSIRRRRHSFTVTPKIPGRDPAGARTFLDGLPVTVAGNAHPVSATEQESLGLQGQTLYKVYADTWPGGMNSTILWEGPGRIWPGRQWDQIGEALHSSMGVRTRHVTVIIQARTTEVK